MTLCIAPCGRQNKRTIELGSIVASQDQTGGLPGPLLRAVPAIGDALWKILQLQSVKDE